MQQIEAEKVDYHEASATDVSLSSCGGSWRYGRWDGVIRRVRVEHQRRRGSERASKAAYLRDNYSEPRTFLHNKNKEKMEANRKDPHNPNKTE